MIVWVKELTGTLSLDSLSVWMKKNINFQSYVNLDCVHAEDIIIISVKDTKKESDFAPYKVLIYEEVFETISQNVLEEIRYNYDYYYLKNALLKSENLAIDTVISGSSYGLFDIDADRLVKEVNLSLMSQDLYYSLKGIYEVYKRNRNLKNVVLFCGYYYFHSDLSKAQNPNELLRLAKVYQPIFQDLHNCVLLPPKKNILQQSNVFDLQRVADAFSVEEYNQHYFRKDMPRKRQATKVWDDISKDWLQLSESEKTQAGIKRGTQHNKNLKRELSLMENIVLFQKFVTFCNEKNINLLIIVAPASKYYRNVLSIAYRDTFYDVLNRVNGTIHLLDLYGDSMFADEDFNDTDHLNESGAAKMTEAVLQMLETFRLE